MLNKLTTFAEDNALDVYNVNADGNCMFSAVADQLWINGNFCFLATVAIFDKEWHSRIYL
jgi:hypothetical protein